MEVFQGLNLTCKFTFYNCNNVMKKILLIFILLLFYNMVISPEKSFVAFTNSASRYKQLNRADVDFVNHSLKIIHSSVLSDPINVYYKIRINEQVQRKHLIRDFLPASYMNQCIDRNAASEEDKRMIEVFSNGLYISDDPHHNLRYKLKEVIEYLYNIKFDANFIGMFYLKKKGKLEDLNECYQIAEQASEDKNAVRNLNIK